MCRLSGRSRLRRLVGSVFAFGVVAGVLVLRLGVSWPVPPRSYAAICPSVGCLTGLGAVAKFFFAIAEDFSG